MKAATGLRAPVSQDLKSSWHMRARHDPKRGRPLVYVIGGKEHSRAPG